MRVLALLSEEGVRRLRSRCGPHIAIIEASPVGAASHLVVDNLDLLIWDPERQREDANVGALIDAIEHTGIPCLLYMPNVGAHSVRRIVQIVERIGPEVVVHNAPNESVLISQRLRTMSSPSASARTLKLFASALGGLPAVVAARVIALFAGDAIPESAGRFAQSIDRSRSWTESHTQRAGIRSMATVLNCLRAARAWELLESESMTVDRIADACGYRSRRTLEMHFRMLANFSPSRAPRALTTSEFAKRLFAAAVPGRGTDVDPLRTRRQRGGIDPVAAAPD